MPVKEIIGAVTGSAVDRQARKGLTDQRRVTGNFRSDFMSREAAPIQFSSGGLRGSTGPGGVGFNIARTSEMTRDLRGIRSAGNLAGNRFASLREQFGAGAKSFRNARLASLDERRRQAVGGLKEELRRRRIAGSSFDVLATGQLEKEFALAADEISAQSMLESAAMSAQLTAQELEARVSTIKTVIDQANFETGIAAELASQVAKNENDFVLGQGQISAALLEIEAGLASKKAELKSESSEGLGGLAGKIFGKLF